MRSFARGTKAVLSKYLVTRVDEAHFCSTSKSLKNFVSTYQQIQRFSYGAGRGKHFAEVGAYEGGEADVV